MLEIATMQMSMIEPSSTTPFATSIFETVPHALLCVMDHAHLDALPFGVVGLNAGGIVEVYNQTEARLAGLAPESVIGASFFLAVAQCMNNYLVARRFKEEDELDAIIGYVLTFRMRPTPVRLRLMKQAAHPRRFILIQR